MKRRGLLRPEAPPQAPQPPQLPEQPLEDLAFRSAVYSYLSQLQGWGSELAKNINKREQSTDDALARIEFPTPDSRELGGSNVAVSLVRFAFRQPTATGIFPAIEVFHGLERTPRFWWVIQQSAPGRAAPSDAMLLDQIVSSQFPFAYVAGYATADVDAVDRRIITGGGAANGWVGNDVRVGDEILLEHYLAATGVTANLTAGSEIVTAAVGVFDPNLVRGSYVRFPGVATLPMKGWNLVDLVKTPTTLLLASPSTATAAATATEFERSDRLWRRIVAVTSDAGGDILVLDPRGAPTDIPLGTTGCTYVIRRPPNRKTSWVRVPIDSDDPVVLLLAFA